MNDALGSGLAGRGLVCVRGERTVFSGLDFAVPPGGALVLRGPNGSGKTSLLRLVAGLLKPAAGTLLRDGAPLERDRHRAGLVYIGHRDPIKPVLSVAENLAFWSGRAGGSEAALDAVGLAALAALPGQVLSAGQRRRLNLARLFLASGDSEAGLWLLDEPAVGLDQESATALAGGIAAHRARGGMVMVATHGDIELKTAATLSLADFAPNAEAARAHDWFAA